MQKHVLDAVGVELLRAICSSRNGLPAARAFAATAMRRPGGADTVTPSALAQLACRLDSLGLVLHLLDPRGRIYLSATPAGRIRLAQIDRTLARKRALGRASVAAGVATPLLVSCVATAPRPPEKDAAVGAPKVAARTAQVELDGQPTWVVCTTPQACPGPTPKTRQIAVPVPQPVPAVAATPSPPSPPSPPTFKAVSMFYATGSAKLSATERQHVQAALQIAKRAVADKNARVFVVGMTDLVGSAKFNAELAHRRAEAVRDLLAKEGVDRTRISTQVDTSASRGVPPQAAQRPVPAGRFAPFRRVDVVVMQRSAQPGEELRVWLQTAAAAGPAQAAAQPPRAASAPVAKRVSIDPLATP